MNSSLPPQLTDLASRARALRAEAKQVVAVKPFNKKRVAEVLEKIRVLGFEMNSFIEVKK